ncbi:MAG: DUF4331 family protein [Myxococcota bacterium]
MMTQKTDRSLLPLAGLALVSLGLTACPGDDGLSGGGSSTGDTTGSSTTTDPPTVTDPTPADSTSSTTDDMTGSSSSTGPEIGPFEFNPADPDTYTQYDRAGFPAVSSGLVLNGDKDAYNLGTPSQDADLTFLSDIRDSLFTLHFGHPDNVVDSNTGLDDDLLEIPIDPCDGSMNGSCEAQGGPFVIPDVLALNLDADPADPLTAFPNGRRPHEAVMDLILAVLLVEISEVQPITRLQDLDEDGVPGPSINPLTNDVEFPGAFPYVAPAHE